MIFFIVVQIVDNVVDLLLLRVLAHDWLLQALHQHLDLAPLGRLPEVPRDVEHDGLQEQDEAHPLVVLVVLDLGPGFEVGVGGNTRVRRHLGIPGRPPAQKETA